MPRLPRIQLAAVAPLVAPLQQEVPPYAYLKAWQRGEALTPKLPQP
jgi:hypothetical protein